MAAACTASVTQGGREQVKRDSVGRARSRGRAVNPVRELLTKRALSHGGGVGMFARAGRLPGGRGHPPMASWPPSDRVIGIYDN